MSFKHKIIETNKGMILVVDLPQDAQDVQIENKTYPDRLKVWFSSKIQDPFQIGGDCEVIEGLSGNWQPLTFFRRNAMKICDQFRLSVNNYKYRDYSDSGQFVDTALESLQSLIDKEVLRENPYGNEHPSIEDYILEEHPELPGNPKEYYEDEFLKDMESWQQAEAKVFKNPFYWYQLKDIYIQKPKHLTEEEFNSIMDKVEINIVK